MKERTHGIVILATFLFLCVLPAVMMSMVAGISGPPDKTIFQVLIRWFFITLPILFLVAGVGVLRLKKWGRRLTLFISFAMLLWVGFMCTARGIATGNFDYLTYLFSVLVLLSMLVPFSTVFLYLIRPQVKERFGKKG